MVHFPGLARARLCIQRAVPRFCRSGLPHSEIPGSKPACGSPRLIAASHVLLRLLAPRHPPYALSSLTTKLTQLSLSRSAEKFVAFHKSALLPRTVWDTPEKQLQRQLPPESHSPGAIQQFGARRELAPCYPDDSEGVHRDLLMPVSIFKEPSPATYAGARPRRDNKKPGAKRRAVMPRLVGAQREA